MGERVPLEDASIDTVVITFVLCTIPDWAGALAEVRRVLKVQRELLKQCKVNELTADTKKLQQASLGDPLPNLFPTYPRGPLLPQSVPTVLY